MNSVMHICSRTFVTLGSRCEETANINISNRNLKQRIKHIRLYTYTSKLDFYRSIELRNSCDIWRPIVLTVGKRGSLGGPREQVIRKISTF